MTTDIKKVGRPAGSLNKSAINKTKVITEAITADRIIKYLDKLDKMMMDDECNINDFIKGLQLVLRYNLLTPDQVFESETIKEIGSKEESDKILAAIKRKLLENNQ